MSDDLGRQLESLNSENPDDSPNGENPIIVFLQKHLQVPFLNLLIIYLNNSNNYTRKTIKSCLSDFRVKHPFAYKFIYTLDNIVHIIFLSVVFLFAVRGLGLESMFKGIMDYIFNI
jgi:hypothetical protein